jgi:hypothetical protein
MKQAEGKVQGRQDRNEADRHRGREAAEPSLDQVHAAEADALTIGETKFHPRVNRHRALLSEPCSDARRSTIVLHLQRTYGNSYVQRLLSSMSVQARPIVRDPTDIHEREANGATDTLTGGMSPQTQRQCGEEAEQQQTRPASRIQRQEEGEEVEQEEAEGEPVQAEPASRVQRQEEGEEVEREEAEGEPVEAEPASRVQRQDEEEEVEQEEAEGEPVQAEPASRIQRQDKEEDEGQAIQELEAGTQPGPVSPDLKSRIKRARGGGQPLTESVRSAFEPHFQRDLGSVRVHTDHVANMLSRQLGAKAFTTARDIFFREGAYQPDTDAGKGLLARQLTSVVQQAAAPFSPQPTQGKKGEERAAFQSGTHPRGSSSDWGQARERADSNRPQVDWSSDTQSDATSAELRWSAAPSPSGLEISWTAPEAGQAIAEPQQLSWGSSGHPLGAEGAGAIPSAIAAPILTTLANLETTYRVGVRGVAPWPANAKAPSFSLNASDERALAGFRRLFGAGTPNWVATPTLTQKAAEGDSQPLYLGKGLHQTTTKESGVYVYNDISAAISQLDYDAEDEHGKDYKHAYQISCREAEDVLKNHVVGKSFGPKPTRSAVEQMVLDTITAKLSHSQLGNDKTKWLDKYWYLQQKTLDRDKKGWHTFNSTNRREVKDDKGKVIKVVYDLVRGGKTRINAVASKDVIKY